MRYGKSTFVILTTIIFGVATVIFTVNHRYLNLTHHKIGDIFNHISEKNSEIFPSNHGGSVDYTPYFDVHKNDSSEQQRIFIPALIFSHSPPMDIPLTTVDTWKMGQRSESNPEDFPSLNSFIEEMIDGIAGYVRGVYAYETLALPVVQQPPGDFAYISEIDNQVTQFQNATAYGVIGLLAHNHLSGRLFFDLELGDEVVIVYGDGHFRTFLVSTISKYQRIEQGNLRSDFINLSTGEYISSAQLFQRHYKGGEWATFQTCLEKEDVLDWGLIIIEAIPKVEEHIEGVH
jgi:hypothetical protein